MGKSAALSNFHLKADQDGLASYRAGCQPWNIVSTKAQTKRCWAGPSQFIRVWIQHRICLVLLEARSDLCPAIISSASNGKSILQTFSPGSSHLTRARPNAWGEWRALALETIPARPDTAATLHTSTAIIIMGVPIRAVERGHITYQIAISAQERGHTEDRYRRPPSWESKTQFRGSILATDASTANRHLAITPTVACLCPRPRTWDSHSHQNSNTIAPQREVGRPCSKVEWVVYQSSISPATLNQA